LTYMQLLRGNRSFRRLWAGQVVSELGNWFDFIAALGLVRSVAGGAPEATAWLIVLRLAPFAIFAPFAGALVDRWPRRTVMLFADIARVVVVLGYLLVRRPEDLWIAYVCSVASSLLGALFEAGKNSATPNIVGDSGLLAGNALMFSSRFLLMAIGAALGGAVSARFGYKAAFVIDSLSFLVSAYSVWLIPGREMKQPSRDEARSELSEKTDKRERLRVLQDIREGWSYIARHPLVATIIGVNILWATGGGAGNLVYDRLGSVVFAGQGSADANIAVFFFAVGAGLFIGMMFARRVGVHVELRGMTVGFIGWTLIAHGLFFALAGLMPKLWLSALMLFMSRMVIGVEFAIQETLIMRLLPDNLRGRVFTTDRAAEIFVMSISAIVAGWALHLISPRALTVISGLLSATPGVMWLALFASGRLRLPAKAHQGAEAKPAEEALLASTG
ncbi:MAG: MFS transporter, partial [Pyrinomonadaceae bacterium]